MNNKSIIRLKVRIARGFGERLFGLIGYKQTALLVIYTRWGIHSFGMRFPIDVVVLDGNNRVVSLRENLKPNWVFFWNPKYDRVLELPGGEIQEKGISLGSLISCSIVR